MSLDRSHQAGAWRGPLFLAVALCLALVVTALASAASPTAMSTASDAARLSTAIADSAQLARVRLGPEGSGLARGLPGITKRLDSLRQPAAITEEQLSVALGQLQQMSALTYDPHYLPALIAVGRAYVAASGVEPLIGTAVDPEYAGLGRELDAAHAGLSRSAAHAALLSKDVKALAAKLATEKRRAARLAGALDRLRNNGARPRS